jgi:7,8-dihydropterin-6-yl-methyl-4-(beta-D-ribofuranosyl)aminobenzene 5'-phosphate synthase
MSRSSDKIICVAIALGLSGFALGCKRTGQAEQSPVPESDEAVSQGTGDNRVLNLYDAFGRDVPGLVQDFGFSALVTYRGKTILFDSGSNADVLKQNVEALGVDLREVDFAVASHSHFDHINGFDYLLTVNPSVKIYFPDDPFFGGSLSFNAAGTDPKAVNDLPIDQRYFRGQKTKFEINQSGRFWRADVEYVDASREIAPGMHLVATRSPFIGYFSRYPNLGITGEPSNSDVNTIGLPELSLCLTTSEGAALIVGCSHSLVETIVREAKELLELDVSLVVGGYHLLPYTEVDILAMARRMKNDLGVKRVAPAHCTGHLGFRVFRDIYGEAYAEAGLGSTVRLPD